LASILDFAAAVSVVAQPFGRKVVDLKIKPRLRVSGPIGLMPHGAPKKHVSLDLRQSIDRVRDFGFWILDFGFVSNVQGRAPALPKYPTKRIAGYRPRLRFSVRDLLSSPMSGR
jgi:hypothetical protein